MLFRSTAPFRGGTWNERDTILFADDRGLHVVPAAGGQAKLIAAPDSGSPTSFRWPEFLPGGRAALFSTFDRGEDRLAAITLASGEIRTYDLPAANPHFVEQGYVAFPLLGSDLVPNMVGAGTLMAVPFDASRLEVLGDPFPVAGGVQVGPTSRTGKFGISRRGTIAFATAALGAASLVEISREGDVRDLGAPPRPYGSPRLSPDGRRVSLYFYDGTGADNWVFDRGSRTLTRVTFDGTGTRAIWTPDGRHLIYSRGGLGFDLARIRVDGSAPAETLAVGDDYSYPADVTPDGRTVILRSGGESGRRTLASVSLGSDHARRTLLEGA